MKDVKVRHSGHLGESCYSLLVLSDVCSQICKLLCWSCRNLLKALLMAKQATCQCLTSNILIEQLTDTEASVHSNIAGQLLLPSGMVC